MSIQVDIQRALKQKVQRVGKVHESTICWF